MPSSVLLILFLVVPFGWHSHVEATEEQSVKKDQPQKSKKHKAERFVMPMTQWLERKAHDSRVLNPASDRINAKPKSENNQLLRMAIRHALRQHSGTVLSAIKEAGPEDTLNFKVTILSASGTINELNVSSVELVETEEQ